MTDPAKRKLPFLVLVGIIVFLPFLGKGGLLAAAILAGAVLGSPSYMPPEQVRSSKDASEIGRASCRERV